MPGTLGLIRCPECDGVAIASGHYVPHQMVWPPPRQTEPFVLLIRWQCFMFESHTGTLNEPAEHDQVER